MKKLFIASLILMVCACTDWKSGETGLADLSWGTAELCIEAPIAPGEKYCYQIKIELDTLAGESELARQLASVLRDSVLNTPGLLTIQKAISVFADSIETDWKAELAENYEPESEYKDMFQYYYNVEGKALSESSLKGEEPNQEASPSRGGLEGSVLSYQVTTSCYLGGAHGSYVVWYYNFDRANGKLLNIEDIVPADKEKEVLKAMEVQLCGDWDAKDLADLQEKTGITMLGDLYLTNNFLLKKDSITFLFNQYEIAPYAAGLISVTIPFAPSR